MSSPILAMLSIVASTSFVFGAEIRIVAQPLDHVITLPISTTVESLPTEGASVRPLHTFSVRPEMFQQTYGRVSPMANVEASDQKIVFAAPVAGRMDQVFSELYRRGELANSIADFGEKPSLFAQRDPLGWTALSEEDRKLLDAVRAATLSALWKDSMANLRSEAIKDSSGRYAVTSLERVIEKGLDQAALRMLAVSVNLSPDALSKAASSILAEEVRRRNHRFTPTTANPFALYQTVEINDPVLTLGGTFRGTMDQFIAFKEQFCRQASAYWTEVWSGQLINDRDLLSLAAWGVSTDAVPFLLAAGENPPDVMSRWCARADAGIASYENHVAMVREIAYWASYYLVESYPPGAAGDGTLPQSEHIGRFLADGAAATLGLGPEIAQSHYLTYPQYVAPLHRHLLDSRFSLLAIADPSFKLEGLEGVSDAERAARLLAPIITTNIVSRYWSNPIEGFAGGVSIVNPVRSLPLERAINARWDDWERGARLLNDLLADPAGRREATAAGLEQWRANWDIGVRRSQMGAIPSAEEDFNDYWLGYHRLVDGFASAQANVSKYQDLIGVARDFNRSIGHRSLEPKFSGQIVLPPDSIVTRVLARSGVFLAQGTPLVTVTERFSKLGRAKLSLPDLKASGLRPGDVLYQSRDASSALALAATVTSVQADDDGAFDIGFAIGLVIRTSDLLPDAAGFPPYLPMTDRYCAFEVLDAATCQLASRYLSTEVEELSFDSPR